MRRNIWQSQTGRVWDIELTGKSFVYWTSYVGTTPHQWVVVYILLPGCLFRTSLGLGNILHIPTHTPPLSTEFTRFSTGHRFSREAGREKTTHTPGKRVEYMTGPKNPWGLHGRGRTRHLRRGPSPQKPICLRARILRRVWVCSGVCFVV